METNGKESKKCLFIDLNGTLIVTQSGKPFPRGIWDMKFRYEVLDAIKALQPEFVGIATNQGGIEKGYVNSNYFDTKCGYIVGCVKEYTGVKACYLMYCPTNDPDAPIRKPNTGILEKMNCNYYNKSTGDSIGPWPLEQCLMVGDASGLEGQFSDSDRRTAENYGCDYMDVEEFVQRYGTLKGKEDTL